MNRSIRNVLISIFVVIWLFVFHYESTRAFFLKPLFKKDLPKLKFLFPPAGWIMFFKVDDRFSYVEVFGLKANKSPQFIDPHLIFETKQIGYDNIHRGALLSFASIQAQPKVCQFLHRKFSYFDDFLITYVEHPSLVRNPYEQNRYILYQCQSNARE